MNKLMRFAGILLYVTLVIYALGLGEQLYKHFEMQVFSIYYPWLLIRILYPIIIGILIGLPNLIGEMKKQGSWQWDWIKFLAIGIPAFIVGVYPALYYAQILESLHLRQIIPTIYQTDTIIHLSNVVLGYYLVSTIYKTIKD